jgi:type I site-specific restriction-modification system R (restriction) subunit
MAPGGEVFSVYWSLEDEKGLMLLLELMRTGLREMPSNSAWLLAQALKPAAAVADAAPFGGDSVAIRARRAHEAAERARETEARALEAARESKARAAYARQVGERGRARMTEVERETSRDVKQRVAEAQKAANEFVRRERQAAEADAAEDRKEVQDEIDEEIEEAHLDAEAAQQRAEELVEEAAEALAEAKRLADEAAQAARAAAEEANRQAKQLADEADQQASDAEARIGETEELRDHLAAAAKHAARQLNRDTANGGLKSYNKPELVELAASMDIQGRSSMTKGELVQAITRASRKR